MDYTCEKGAKRNFEPWRPAGGPQETDEERLDRLEQEAAEVDAMGELEGKMVDAKREMAIADALDEIRSRNARNERAAKEGGAAAVAGAVEEDVDKERERQEKEDEELARKAFAKPVEDTSVKVTQIDEASRDDADKPSVDKSGADGEKSSDMPPPAVPNFKRGVKRKKDFSAALGIKKKAALV